MTDRYTEILARVAKIKEQRGAMYRNEPRKTVPLEILEAVALLKAYRGYESISTEKKIDEYNDLINYSVFIIERLEDQQKQEHLNAKHMDFSGTSSQQTMKVIDMKIIEGSDPGTVRGIPSCFGKHTPDCIQSACGSYEECVNENIKKDTERCLDHSSSYTDREWEK